MTSETTRRVLLTGASSGIGRATALALAKEGMDLLLVGRSLSRLEPIQQAASALGATASVAAIDLTDLPQVKTALEAAIADFGPVDVLINNAGMAYTGPLAEMSLGDWQRVMDLNLTSVWLCMQAVLPGMRDRQQGTVINIASIAAYTTFPDWGAYSVSKAGLVSLSRAWAAEERNNGIRVTVLAPGAVNTPLWDTETVNVDFPRDAMLTPETVAQVIVQTLALPNHAVVEELKLMPSGGAL